MFVHVSATLSPKTALKALFSGRLQQEEHLKYYSFARGALITAIDCKYYHLTKDLEPDFSALEVDFCSRKGLLLIEDCTHSIVKNVGKSKVGTRGEAGVFIRLRKVLPIPNGGILYLKNARFCLPPTLHTTQSVYRRVTKMMVQWLFQTAGRSWYLRQDALHILILNLGRTGSI